MNNNKFWFMSRQKVTFFVPVFMWKWSGSRTGRDNRFRSLSWYRCNAKASIPFHTTHLFPVPVLVSVLPSVNTPLWCVYITSVSDSVNEPLEITVIPPQLKSQSFCFSFPNILTGNWIIRMKREKHWCENWSSILRIRMGKRDKRRL